MRGEAGTGRGSRGTMYAEGPHRAGKDDGEYQLNEKDFGHEMICKFGTMGGRQDIHW